MPPKPKTRLAAKKAILGDAISIVLIRSPLLPLILASTHSYFQSFLLHGVDRAVRALCVWNEYIVAELILARNQIFLSALPFSDLIMTFGIAAENSRGFPALFQNLRRRYLKVVV